MIQDLEDEHEYYEHDERSTDFYEDPDKTKVSEAAKLFHA
jgi:hypothetical protein